MVSMVVLESSVKDYTFLFLLPEKILLVPYIQVQDVLFRAFYLYIALLLSDIQIHALGGQEEAAVYAVHHVRSDE